MKWRRPLFEPAALGECRLRLIPDQPGGRQAAAELTQDALVRQLACNSHSSSLMANYGILNAIFVTHGD